MGKAVVREARRNIQDIARRQIFIDNRLERFHVQQRRMRAKLLQRQFVTHAPAAAPHALDDKYVVLIDMRPYAATRNRERDHQIVQPPVR
ncbi:hypothetical protein D3C75_956510 [compost metagenome]